MTGLFLGAILGAGLWLIVTAQPLGRPRPDLALRLRALSAQGRTEMEAAGRRPRSALYKSPLLEQVLRPLLEDAGGQVGRLLARFGIAPGTSSSAWPSAGRA